MLVVGVSGCYPVAPDPTPAVAGGSGIPRTDETWINAKKLTVQNDADFYTDVMIDGDEDAVQLTVQGHSTQTSDLFVAETSAGTDKFTIDNSGNTDIAGTLGVAGASTLTGALAANGGLTLAGLANLTAATSVTVTDGVAFAISGAWQPITAAGAVTPTITIPASGVFACIENTSAQNVLIQDTGNQILTADATLNQYDVLCGYSDGTRFIEVSRANN